jgi:ABC-2 type transport system permease protein
MRASWLHVASYRLQLVVSLTGLVAAVVPVYFISNALQPTMGHVVRDEGGQYFGFLVVGMVTLSCISTAVGALHGALTSEIRSGGLEALFSTPTSLPVLVVGMMGQSFSVTAMRVAVVVLASSMLGADFVWSAAPLALAIMAMLLTAYLGVGVVAASLVLAFKTPGPLPAVILALSAIFGGVYYPVSVIPSWLTHGSSLMPLTYGLRALRQAVLEGAPIAAMRGDLTVLAVLATISIATASVVFRASVQYARATGTLAHY